MALPKIDLPTYKLRLDSLNKEITFRPFVVKEEKILLMALESLDYQTSLDAIKQIINNCVLDEIDVERLPLFEIEYIFLNLRARSIGEVIQPQYICENILEENKKCKGTMSLEVDLLKIVLNKIKIENTIQLSSNVGICLKFPTISISKRLTEKFKSPDAPIEILKECTEYIFDESQVYKKDMPTLKHSAELVCNKCGKNHTIRLEGLLDFFV